MPEPRHLRATRTAYDTVARDYARLLRDALAGSTWDRAVLSAFAELVRAAGHGLVADVGCGPGRLTAHLDALGLDVLGLDLSPGMLAVARGDHPGLRFAEASMTALPLPDGGLAGLVAWYSLIHVPPPDVPGVLRELRRVLRPGGELLLAFQVGDELRHHEQAYGHAVSLNSWRLLPRRVEEQLAGTGVAVHARLVREPEGTEATRQAYLLARRVR